jgi:hypothetical protein
VSLAAVANGLVNGLLNVSLNRVESAEQPESQIPTNPVKATRTAFRRRTTVAILLIVFNPLERNQTWPHFERIVLREGLR